MVVLSAAVHVYNAMLAFSTITAVWLIIRCARAVVIGFRAEFKL